MGWKRVVFGNGRDRVDFFSIYIDLELCRFVLFGFFFLVVDG